MAFIQPCSIRKNTPELRKKLEELGYKYSTFDDLKLDGIITFPAKSEYSVWANYHFYGKHTLKSYIDCGTNEDLFLALATLRDRYCDPQYYWIYADPGLRVGVLCPVMIVYKMLEKHFGFRRVYMMQIHGIDVDTQDENTITVTIRLYRPGRLIGKGGKDIDAVRDMMESYFNKKTRIDIVEVKNDVNEPIYV